MTAHTPGPWQLGWNTETDMYQVDSVAEDAPIADVWSTDTAGERARNGESAAKANACLMAAAPEMLEALQQLVRGHDGKREDGDRPITLARAAIAKATGGGK